MDIIKELEINEITTTENTNQDNNIMPDFFNNGIRDIDDFDELAWKKGDGISFPNFKNIEEKLEGADSGLYIFAGLSNHGKTAMMTNIIMDAVKCEKNNLYGLFFSLDDSKREVIPRLVAMDQEIPISVVSKPNRYKSIIDAFDNGETDNTDINAIIDTEQIDVYREYLEKRTVGLNNLKSNCNKIKIEDSNTISVIDDIYAYIVKAITYIKAIDENKNIIIAIDSINDVNLKKNDNEIMAEVAKRIKKWTVEFNCIIFASAHVRKINANRRPALDDIYDSTVLCYEASLIFILYNDVSANGPSSKIFYMSSNGEEKKPIIEINFAKNKVSSYKGYSFAYFIPEYSKTIECNKNDIDRYSALLYEA